MDIVPQPLLELLNKVGSQLEAIGTELKSIKNASEQNAEAIKEQTSAHQNAQYSQRRVLAEFKIPQAEKYRQDTVAQDTLHISERAYISFTDAQINYDKSEISFKLLNSGRIPSGQANVTTYEATFNLPVPTGIGRPFRDIVERHKGINELMAIPPTITSPAISLDIPTPSMSKDKLSNGTQLIVIVGSISYNDGFPKSQIQTTPICIETVFHRLLKDVYLVPCNASVELPKFEAMDWTNYTSR